ncbi:MAG: SDR family NAD(P)-dependent oxidoreductase [Spirochaetes bacterium]|nr:SDR family NAD(P)-dependent oxidoreductase [Spirochaetota bacterium]
MKKTVIITGGNRGIGAAMAEALAAAGYAVKIVCRSRVRAEEFIASTRARGITGIDFIEGDLSTIASSIETADRIRAGAPAFHAFVHNAALWPTKKFINADGLEQSFVTNHLAPFILNRRLEDLFTANRARVVQISAGLYIAGKRDCAATASGDNYSLMKTYATTKLHNLIATMRFAELWKGKPVTINAIHPGVVNTALGEMKGFGGTLLRLLKKLCLSPADGAAAPVRLVTDPAYESLSGAYFDRYKQTKLAPVALDGEFNRAVWEQAVSLAARAGRR